MVDFVNYKPRVRFLVDACTVISAPEMALALRQIAEPLTSRHADTGVLLTDRIIEEVTGINPDRWLLTDMRAERFGTRLQDFADTLTKPDTTHPLPITRVRSTEGKHIRDIEKQIIHQLFLDGLSPEKWHTYHNNFSRMFKDGHHPGSQFFESVENSYPQESAIRGVLTRACTYFRNYYEGALPKSHSLIPFTSGDDEAMREGMITRDVPRYFKWGMLDPFALDNPAIRSAYLISDIYIDFRRDRIKPPYPLPHENLMHADLLFGAMRDMLDQSGDKSITEVAESSSSSRRNHAQRHHTHYIVCSEDNALCERINANTGETGAFALNCMTTAILLDDMYTRYKRDIPKQLVLTLTRGRLTRDPEQGISSSLYPDSIQEYEKLLRNVSVHPPQFPRRQSYADDENPRGGWCR